MPAKSKKSARAKHSRVPEGKAQMLSILEKDVIKNVKIAAAQDGRRISHVVEEALKEWLERRAKQT